MNNQLIFDYIHRHTSELISHYLTASSRAGANQFECPFCGSGTGHKGTGAFTYYPDKGTFYCFSCNKRGDILDVIAEVENITDPQQAIKRALELLGATEEKIAGEIFIDVEQPQSATPFTGTTSAAVKTNFSDFYKLLDRHSPIFLNYMKKRGITDIELINRFNIGFCQHWKHPKQANNPNITGAPHVIIPTSDYGYTARSINPASKWRYTKAGDNSTLFNEEALYSMGPVIVVEGVFDALAVLMANPGHKVVALGTTANRRIYSIIEQRRNSGALLPPFICFLDQDEAGTAANLELLEGLKARGATALNGHEYIHLADFNKNKQNDLYGKDLKDLNELLVHLCEKDTENGLNEFRSLIAELLEASEKNIANEEQEAYNGYMAKYNGRNKLQAFMQAIQKGETAPVYPTPFSKLNEQLLGGFSDELILIGAITSLGKTAWALQVADHLAENGQDVIIFSLEMGARDLMARSISREMYKTMQGNIFTTGGTSKYFSAMDIKQLQPAQLERQEYSLLEQAITKYNSYSDKIYIVEPDYSKTFEASRLGPAEIEAVIAEHIRLTNKRPFVIIDFIQIMKPINDKASDKKNIDDTMHALKKICIDHRIPIMAISSFNRLNYDTKVNLASFKESGQIEYLAETVIGLQMKGAGDKKTDVDEAKRKNPREVELVILKRRGGPTGHKVNFNYNPKANYFEEA